MGSSLLSTFGVLPQLQLSVSLCCTTSWGPYGILADVYCHRADHIGSTSLFLPENLSIFIVPSRMDPSLRKLQLQIIGGRPCIPSGLYYLELQDHFSLLNLLLQVCGRFRVESHKWFSAVLACVPKEQVPSPPCTYLHYYKVRILVTNHSTSLNDRYRPSNSSACKPITLSGLAFLRPRY